ncbi:MAG: META domain-containing protein [Phycisphaerales bacterium]|nr:META domain-containing protein [Phycisphaerales bacterium]
MKPLRRSAVLLLGAALLGACASNGQKAGDGNQVDPTVLRGEWYVSVLDGGPAVPQTPNPISVVFEDEELSGVGKLRGFSGVNRFFGAYTATPTGTLEVGAVGSTRMAGPPDLQAFETSFLKWLGHSQRFSVDAEGVTIVTSDGAMRLVRP